MALDVKAGQNIRVTISRTIVRDSARKTIERLFLKDKSVARPIETRSRNFMAIPKRRGGCIWTKRPNLIHPNLDRGTAATILVTAQTMRDLASVESFVTVAPA
jgi:hypothetical protein